MLSEERRCCLRRGDALTKKDVAREEEISSEERRCRHEGGAVDRALLRCPPREGSS
jgi:hypothetical protein